MTTRKVFTVFLSIVIALFIVSASISIPIVFRGLYYSQIEKLNLVEETGYSEEVIRGAFDEMMDYCVGGGADSDLEFGTGELKWSESGKLHFDDVAKLFSLDFWILEFTLGVLFFFGFFMVLNRRGESVGSVSSEYGHLSNVAPGSIGEQKMNVLHPYRFLGRGPLFWGPTFLIVTFAILGIYIARDFDSFFVTFHHTFFPGKDNWIFDQSKDEIIRILPEEVFRNFAVLIVAAILILSAIFIIVDIFLGMRSRKESR